MIKCDMCEKYFPIGKRADGTPNGVGFHLEDGSVINVCSSCIEITAENPRYFDEFLEKRRMKKK